jgi:hypothetical protein
VCRIVDRVAALLPSNSSWAAPSGQPDEGGGAALAATEGGGDASDVRSGAGVPSAFGRVAAGSGPMSAAPDEEAGAPAADDGLRQPETKVEARTAQARRASRARIGDAPDGTRSFRRGPHQSDDQTPEGATLVAMYSALASRAGGT